MSKEQHQHIHHANELAVPRDAAKDVNAVEFLRAWTLKEGMQVSLHPTALEPAGWGMFMADLLRHVANAYSQKDGRNIDQTGQQILDYFLAEFHQPTVEKVA